MGSPLSVEEEPLRGHQSLCQLVNYFTPLCSTYLETKSCDLAQGGQFEFQCFLLPLPRRLCCESRRWRNRVLQSNSNILFSTNSTKQRQRSKWTKLFSTYTTSLRVTPTTTSSWLSDDVLRWIFHLQFLQSLLTKLLMQKTHFFKSGATMGNNSEPVKEVEVHMYEYTLCKWIMVVTSK